MLIGLIENDAAFGDDPVLGFVNRDLVSLKPISADACVDVSFVDERRARFQVRNRSASSMSTVISSVADTLHAALRRRTTLHRLICIEWIDVGSVGHRIRDFPIDRIRLLRKYKLAGKEKDQVCQQQGAS